MWRNISLVIPTCYVDIISYVNLQNGFFGDCSFRVGRGQFGLETCHASICYLLTDIRSLLTDDKVKMCNTVAHVYVYILHTVPVT